MTWLLPSFLTPTFLVLGLLAISLPVLFHFFRRTPKGNVQFSSLRFLRASPPRLTSRSRVDNWLLLILRGLVLLFIALAFGRIFFRQTDFLSLSDLPSRRVAILVDTSASMMRGELWKQARESFNDLIDDFGPNDDVAVFAFDSELQTIVGFSSGESGNESAKVALARGALQSVNPRWQTTDLGKMLIEAVDLIQNDRENDATDQISESQIVVITDLQSGSNLKDLQSFEWPQNIPVEVISVGADTDNATLGLLEDSKSGAGNASLRVKVSNANRSSSSEFDLDWITSEELESNWAGKIVVPPGQSRIINLQLPDYPFSGLELSGDADAFDNQFFIAQPKLVPEKILFAGENKETRRALRFYLQKACSSLIGKRLEFLDDSKVTIAEAMKVDGDKSGRPDIVFVTGKLDLKETEQLREFNNGGGLICIVVTDKSMLETVTGLVGQEVEISDPKNLDYALLAEIDFNNRLFARYADPKFSNFSGIRFWKYRKVNSDAFVPIARFDTGDLAIGSLPKQDGQLFLFTSGWDPNDSQFALSSKFVGVMLSMMLKKLTVENKNLTLGDPLRLSEFIAGKSVSIKKPDENRLELDNTTAETIWNDADMPGIYELSSGNESTKLAFNLPPEESRTSLMSTELLEQEGLPLGTMTSALEKVEKERQRKDKELENRQKLWRWMLILALVLLFLETALSSRLASGRTQSETASQET